MVKAAATLTASNTTLILRAGLTMSRGIFCEKMQFRDNCAYDCVSKDKTRVARASTAEGVAACPVCAV